MKGVYGMDLCYYTVGIWPIGLATSGAVQYITVQYELAGWLAGWLGRWAHLWQGQMVGLDEVAGSIGMEG